LTHASVIKTHALRVLPGANESGGFNCPAHTDSVASGSWSVGKDGRPLVRCHAGCSNTDIARALNFAGEKDLYDALEGQTKKVTTKELLKHPIARYTYHDERGTALFFIRRYAYRGRKTFRQFAQDGTAGIDGIRRVVYRLHKLQGRLRAYWVEGEKCVKALVRRGLTATTNPGGADGWRAEYATQLRDAGLKHVTVIADQNEPGRKVAQRVADDCHAAGLIVKLLLHLPNLADSKDIDDWFRDGHTADDLERLRTDAPRYPYTCTLTEAERVFRKWFGKLYDLAALHAVLAAAAVERLTGEPLWVMVVAGPGNTKTETVSTLSGIGAQVTSTIASEGALLSATPRKDVASHATGGLLRALEPRGILVMKDFTTILSMPRETRNQVLAALREVYDGKWTRSVGTDGGQTIHWDGRIAIIGAVTTAWDDAHTVIGSMGERFVLVRTDSRTGRRSAGRHAIANIGREREMREELAKAVSGVVSGMTTDDTTLTLTRDEREHVRKAADLTALCRTAVANDFRGEPERPHAHEAATRLAKQLVQMMRGALAIGLPRTDALALALRGARDSMPPLRLRVLEDVTAHPGSKREDVSHRLDLPATTVRRTLDSLQLLKVLTRNTTGKTKVHRYAVAEDLTPSVLHSLSEKVSRRDLGDRKKKR
jgi:hypothetical protein